MKFTLPKVEGQIMASHKGIATGAMVSGLRAQDIDKKPLLIRKIAPGELAAFKRGEGVIIGKRMADKMRLAVGDDLTLISPRRARNDRGAGAKGEGLPRGGNL